MEATLKKSFNLLTLIGISLGGRYSTTGYNLFSRKFDMKQRIKTLLALILIITFTSSFNPFVLQTNATCGDKTIDTGEECEPPNTSSCDSACKAILCDNTTLTPDNSPFCGNGTVEPTSEACDDGNNISYDTCTNDCRQGPNYSDLTTDINYGLYSSATQSGRTVNSRFQILAAAAVLLPAVIRPCGSSAPACNGLCLPGQTCAAMANGCICVPAIACNMADAANNCVGGISCPNAADGRNQFCAPMAGMCLCIASAQQIAGNPLNNCMPNPAVISVELTNISGKRFSNFANEIDTLITQYPNVASDLMAYKTMVLNTIGDPATFLTSLGTNLTTGMITGAMGANSQFATLKNLFDTAPTISGRFRNIGLTNANGKDFMGLNLQASSITEFSIGGENYSTNVDLTCTDLTMANLESVWFKESASSMGAILKGATLVGAALNKASLRNADLSPSAADGFPGADISEVDFSMAYLTGANFKNVRFTTAPTFSGTFINNLQIDSATFNLIPGSMPDGMIMGANGTANVLP